MNLNQGYRWKVDLQNNNLFDNKKKKIELLICLCCKMSYLYSEHRTEMGMIKAKMSRSEDWKFNQENTRGIQNMGVGIEICYCNIPLSK